jgi:hypothetical protein
MGSLVWRTGVEKVTNENAWRESPSEFGHSYLFPMEPRTFALSPQASLWTLARRYNLRLILDSSVGRAPDC